MKNKREMQLRHSKVTNELKPPAMSSYKIIQMALFLVFFLAAFSSVAAVNGPSIVNSSSFTITWTNTSNNTLGTWHYYIREYQSGNYQKTYYVYSRYPKSYLVTGKNPGSYTYEVYYRAASGTGSGMFLAGEHRVTVLSSADAQRDIKFVHTDLLGSPVAETDINGELN